MKGSYILGILCAALFFSENSMGKERLSIDDYISRTEKGETLIGFSQADADAFAAKLGKEDRAPDILQSLTFIEFVRRSKKVSDCKMSGARSSFPSFAANASASACENPIRVSPFSVLDM